MQREHFRRFTVTDRAKLEALHNAGIPIREIAKQLHKHISSIYRELKRGEYEHLNSDYTVSNRYSSDKAEQRHSFYSAGMGRPLKLGNDYEFVRFVEQMVKQGYSPYAILKEIRRQGLSFRTKVCLSTLYNYIDKGLFLHIGNKDLLRKGSRRKKYGTAVKVKRAPRGESIERRPDLINTRQEFGHWEMDSVIGRREKGNTLVVLTERISRFEIILKSKDKSAISTVQLLNRLERMFGRHFQKIFRTITVDNGTEFSQYEQMERSCLTKRQRTKIYYCHPYSSWERGSNENQNGMIRRFIPKGTKIEQYSQQDLNRIADWMNDYPRFIFDGKSSRDIFTEQLKKLGIKKIF